MASARMPAASAMRATGRRCAFARLSQPVRIFSVTGTSTACTTASRMRPTSGSSLQQRRAGHHVADLLRRAAHVDVDDLRAVVDVVACGLAIMAGSAPAICTETGSTSPSWLARRFVLALP
jgi:hypothetical protein